MAVETDPLAERMQTALGPCCENDIIFDATSSPTEIVITCGVKPIPAEPKSISPREANCCLVPDPGGRPLPRFCIGMNDDDDAAGALTGVLVDNVDDIDPSGPYFLGRPLFLFTGSPDGDTPVGAPTFDAAAATGDSTGNVDPAELAPKLDCTGNAGFAEGRNPGGLCAKPVPPIPLCK